MQLNARQTDEYSLSLALFGLSLHAQQQHLGLFTCLSVFVHWLWWMGNLLCYTTLDVKKIIGIPTSGVLLKNEC